MRHCCPVCVFAELPYPPADYHICPCCGTEFGNDDEHFSHDQLREMWTACGAQWFFGRPPEGWNPWKQLIDGGHPESVPRQPLRVVTAPTIASPPTVVWMQQPVYEIAVA